MENYSDKLEQARLDALRAEQIAAQKAVDFLIASRTDPRSSMRSVEAEAAISYFHAASRITYAQHKLAEEILTN